MAVSVDDIRLPSHQG